MRTALLLAVLVACASPDSAPAIEKARPPWAPMVGGTTVELFGTSFDPAVNRVFVGGREAPVVRTIDDEHLEIVVPPSDKPGDAEIVVISPTGTVIATGVFRYSEPPAIDSVSPSRVNLAGPPTTVSIRGRGFLDEEAGAPTVLVDGQLVAEVTVRDDSWLTFEAPLGSAFSRANIDVINQRGATAARGFFYTLTDRPGLLVFNLGINKFATFYEPTEGALVHVPYVSSNRPCIYGVVRDAAGTYFASDYCSLPDWGFGRIDLSAQRIVDGVVTGRLYPAMVQHRGTLYAVEYQTDRFGTLSATGDTFTPIGSVPCCDVGLASDNTTMWLVARNGTPAIRTIDPDTGAVGDSVTLVPPTSISDLRWFAGTLYGTTSNGNLVTIDPDTGAVTTLAFVGNAYALDVFD